MRKFSEIIRHLRGNKYTQLELANELEVSKSTVSMWETDKRLPSKELYEQIADLFNVDIDYLYGRTDIRKARHFDNYGSEYISTDHLKEDRGYYLDDETRKIAQELYDNEELKILLDGGRKLKPEDLEFINEMVERLNNER